MEKVTEEKSVIQWHSAFYAEIQIEFTEEAGHLIFENEHQLGTKPKEIDVLIIKKDDEVLIKKNIGRIFRKHNIIEYKSPGDYLSIDDFYKVYGYACFYKSDVNHVDEIKAKDITITFVSKSYPRKVFSHLKREQHLNIENVESGIYYVYGDYFPIQFIVTSQLSEEENFWLKNLTDDLIEPKNAEEILRKYEKYQNESLYQSVMNVIISANGKVFREVENVCEALLEIAREKMQDELNAREELGKEEVLISLVRDGLLSSVEAAKRLSISEEEFMKKI